MFDAPEAKLDLFEAIFPIYLETAIRVDGQWRYGFTEAAPDLGGEFAQYSQAPEPVTRRATVEAGVRAVAYAVEMNNRRAATGRFYWCRYRSHGYAVPVYEFNADCCLSDPGWPAYWSSPVFVDGSVSMEITAGETTFTVEGPGGWLVVGTPWTFSENHTTFEDSLVVFDRTTLTLLQTTFSLDTDTIVILEGPDITVTETTLLTVEGGDTLTIQGPGTLELTTIVIDVSGPTINVTENTTLTVETGDTLTVAGPGTLELTTIVIDVSGPTINVTENTTLTVESGDTLTITGPGTMELTGTIAVTVAGPTITFTEDTFLVIESGDSLTIQGPGVVTLDGTTALVIDGADVDVTEDTLLVIDSGKTLTISGPGDLEFTISPTAPTASPGDNSTTLATTAYVDAAVSGAAGGPTWTKYTVSHSDFTAASTSETITLAALPAKTAVHSVVIKHSAAFGGGSIGSYTLSVSVPGLTINQFVHTTPSNSEFSAQHTALQYVTFGGTNATVTAQATGGNVNTATAGTAEIWLLTSTLP